MSGLSFWSHDGFRNAFSGRGRGVEPLRGHLIRQGTPLRAVHRSGAAWRARSVPCVLCPAAWTEAPTRGKKYLDMRATCSAPTSAPPQEAPGVPGHPTIHFQFQAALELPPPFQWAGWTPLPARAPARSQTLDDMPSRPVPGAV